MWQRNLSILYDDDDDNDYDDDDDEWMLTITKDVNSKFMTT